jgi:putative methionine-R-sulfoxide reductase with GAF domain
MNYPRAEKPTVLLENSRFANSLSQFRIANNNQATIVKLKKYQLNYETRILKLIDQCESEVQVRQSNYKECEELAKNLGKLSNRWKRLTSLVMESLLELDHETQIEIDEFKKLKKKQKKLDKIIQQNEEEVQNMANLSALLSHFIHQAENQQQVYGNNSNSLNL